MSEEYPETSKTGKRYWLEIREDDRYRHYKSGAVYKEGKPATANREAIKGKLVDGPKDSRFTTENAIEMQKKGAESKVNRAIETNRAWLLAEIIAISPDSERIVTWEDAMGAIVGRLGADAFMSDATLLSRTKAAELVARLTASMPDNRVAAPAAGGVNISLGAGVASELVRLLADKAADTYVFDDD